MSCTLNTQGWEGAGSCCSDPLGDTRSRGRPRAERTEGSLPCPKQRPWACPGPQVASTFAASPEGQGLRTEVFQGCLSYSVLFTWCLLVRVVTGVEKPASVRVLGAQTGCASRLPRSAIARVTDENYPAQGHTPAGLWCPGWTPDLAPSEPPGTPAPGQTGCVRLATPTSPRPSGPSSVSR